jgi:glycosyltransferase involved in cell wall biosynthesis
VCYAGSLEKEKGIDTLLESAGGLPGATVLVVGGWPPAGQAMQRFCAQRG